MDTQLQTINQPTVTEADIALITQTVAKGATKQQLAMYLHDCKRLRTHPLDRKLHFTTWGGKYTPIVGIDYMRQLAHETGACLGISDPEFEGDPDEPKFFKATVTAKRLVQGQVADFTATARWSEYCRTDGPMWKKMPHTMLGKCAEALALRKGFPELGKVYTAEEMDQAEAGSVVNVTPTGNGHGEETTTHTAPPPSQALEEEEWIPKDDPAAIVGFEPKGVGHARTNWITFDLGGETLKLSAYHLPQDWSQEAIQDCLDQCIPVQFQYKINTKNGRDFKNLTKLREYSPGQTPSLQMPPADVEEQEAEVFVEG